MRADRRGHRHFRLRPGLRVSACRVPRGGGLRRGPAGGARRDLARQTVAGAGALLADSPLPAATLRQNVTSPKGTTAEALTVLMAEDGLQQLMTRAVAAAKRRSIELG